MIVSIDGSCKYATHLSFASFEVMFFMVCRIGASSEMGFKGSEFLSAGYIGLLLLLSLLLELHDILQMDFLGGFLGLKIEKEIKETAFLYGLFFGLKSL